MTVKSGGLKSISITDNGTGILKENLPILCERFTTSKLSKYEDLQSIRTYGFRGEALASISIVSRVTIQTKTKSDVCAWKAHYDNCQMKEEPTACAGNQGTTITFDDIFYNNPIRQKCLSLPSEEFQKIYDVVSKYAIHNHQISFTLKKHGENNAIKTSPSSSPVDIIRGIYGNLVANSLLDVHCSDDESYMFKMKGLVSGAEYSGKKRQFLLFINNRLVECKSLKKAIFEEIYQKIVTKSILPFVYMSLEVDPAHVDVNVSPTKNEVNFLNELEIVEKIAKNVEERLVGLNDTRKLYTQQLLPGASSVLERKDSSDKDKTYPKDMVRTDAKSQTITKFLQQENADESMNTSESSLPNLSQSSNILSNSQYQKTAKVSLSQNDCELSSIRGLRNAVAKEADEILKPQIEKLTYVGIASRSRTLIQCESILYVVDIAKLAYELFYQLVLKKFENFDIIEFENGIKIKELAMVGFDLEECGWEESDGDKLMLAEQVEGILNDNREMLLDYFGIKINENSELEGLPLIVPSYHPLMSYLPLFLIRLATEVNYEEEVDCFTTIVSELATFYSKLSLAASDEEHEILVETVFLPEIRRHLVPPKKFGSDRTFLKLTSLPDLYKVFERC